MSPAMRDALERLVEAAIDLLDADEAATMEREPDGEDEVVSEDDGVVTRWWPVAVQA